KDTLHTMTFTSALGKIAIGGMGSDTYDGDYICILDLGGNDIYRRPNSNKISALAMPATVILDMGGDDYYEGGECSFASGYFGVSILDDVSGDDIYNGGSFSLGAGFFGAGILLDESGDDKYIGKTFVEGAGAFGFGALIDKSGNDTYLAQIYSQGFGFTFGFGAIVDESGNDTYTVAAEYTDVLRYADHFVTLSQGCGLGYNPLASGGIGIISERGGNDTYSADIFGQGCGYWYSLGAIVDDGGNDRYNAFQYGQGAGIHRAFGVLIDKKGDDYYSSHGVSQGCGHDVGFGALLDLEGDDFYTTESLSLGAGNANAISLFCDAAGNDAYIGKNLSNTFGFSDDRSGYGMIGIFLDLGGNDEYPTYKERNNTVWTKSTFGVGIDADVPDTAAMHKVAEQHADDSVRVQRDLGKDIRTLFIQACAAPQKFQYLVEPSRKKLIERKEDALPYLLSKLSTTNARERNMLSDVLPQMKGNAVKLLIDSLTSSSEQTCLLSLYVLGKIGDSIAASAVLPMLHNPIWRIRASAAEQLGHLKDTSADNALAVAAMSDTVELVRMRAMRSLGELKDDDAADEMIAGLKDRSQLVRNKASEALNLLGEDAKDDVLNSISDASGFQKEYMIELLGNYHKDRKVKKFLTMYLRDDDVATRRAALAAIEKLGDKGYVPNIKKTLKTEENESLRERETALLEKLAPKKKK
ncbi:MAG TPA: HEAT repeat domain-containing protein, partial [Candidatus Kapabacteria bacterium]|nr:HEAT repeat domain-containing protein [Candidatus Kapabacteria bacterium]